MLVKSKSIPLIKVPLGRMRKQDQCGVKSLASVCSGQRHRRSRDGRASVHACTHVHACVHTRRRAPPTPARRIRFQTSSSSSPLLPPAVPVLSLSSPAHDVPLPRSPGLCVPEGVRPPDPAEPRQEPPRLAGRQALGATAPAAVPPAGRQAGLGVVANGCFQIPIRKINKL